MKKIFRRLISDARIHTIPVVVLTARDNPKEVDRCYEFGCNVYITKLVEYDNFTDAIHKFGLMPAVIKLPHRLKK